MKKILILVISIVICLSLVGCDINLSSVDILMRPPKLSGENRLLQQTFEATVGNSESVIMKTPISGEHRSSYLMFDLDNDSVKEALVFYADPTKDNFAYVSVFNFKDDVWSFVSTIKGRSEEVYEVDFADINGDGSLEILISWSSLLSSDSLANAGVSVTNDRTLSIYSYDGENTSFLKSEPYTKLLIEDIDNDNSDELFILNISLNNQEKVTTGRILSFDSAYKIQKDLTFSLAGMLDVYNIVCDSYNIEGETHSRIFIDGSISETGIITEVVDICNSTFEITLPFYESNISAQPVTLRDSRVFSQDVDSDGFVEIPTLNELPGGVRISDNSDERYPLNLTVWSKIIDNQLEMQYEAIFNGAAGYMFLSPDSLFGSTTAVYNESENIITFYEVDENMTLSKTLFSIRSDFKLDYENDSNGYTNFDENGTYIFSYIIYDEPNESVYIDIIEDNFILLNQE